MLLVVIPEAPTQLAQESQGSSSDVGMPTVLNHRCFGLVFQQRRHPRKCCQSGRRVRQRDLWAEIYILRIPLLQTRCTEAVKRPLLTRENAHKWNAPLVGSSILTQHALISTYSKPKRWSEVSFFIWHTVIYRLYVAQLELVTAIQIEGVTAVVSFHDCHGNLNTSW